MYSRGCFLLTIRRASLFVKCDYGILSKDFLSNNFRYCLSFFLIRYVSFSSKMNLKADDIIKAITFLLDMYNYLFSS